MFLAMPVSQLSTDDQDPASQKRRLEAAGARIFEDVISGKTFERPGLSDLLDHVGVIAEDVLNRTLRVSPANGCADLGTDTGDDRS